MRGQAAMRPATLRVPCCGRKIEPASPMVPATTRAIATPHSQDGRCHRCRPYPGRHGTRLQRRASALGEREISAATVETGSENGPAAWCIGGNAFRPTAEERLPWLQRGSWRGLSGSTPRSPPLTRHRCRAHRALRSARMLLVCRPRMASHCGWPAGLRRRVVACAPQRP
jgi:hypothetical protein